MSYCRVSHELIQEFCMGIRHVAELLYKSKNARRLGVRVH